MYISVVKRTQPHEFLWRGELSVVPRVAEWIFLTKGGAGLRVFEVHYFLDQIDIVKVLVE